MDTEAPLPAKGAKLTTLAYSFNTTASIAMAASGDSAVLFDGVQGYLLSLSV